MASSQRVGLAQKWDRSIGQHPHAKSGWPVVSGGGYRDRGSTRQPGSSQCAACLATLEWPMPPPGAARSAGLAAATGRQPWRFFLLAFATSSIVWLPGDTMLPSSRTGRRLAVTADLLRRAGVGVE